MPGLPSGTVTMLFSDIEGSTSMLTRLGADWGQALDSHRALIRAAIAAHGGVEIGTEGDSFFVVFAGAKAALLAAVEAQRALGTHDWTGQAPLRVRMGLHTGEPERHENGYIGLDVHRAARIAATASGGQIVISGSTHGLVKGDAAGVGLRDLGWHRLKDLAEPEHLYDVVAAGLPDRFPPLRSIGTLANLPSYATELVGRSAVVAELCELLGEGARLVTLIGTGGTGKTRLAIAVAEQVQRIRPCEVFLAELHTVDRPSVMWAGIAETVGGPADADVSPEDRALSVLRGRSALLILDNLEQVRDADVVVARLLDQAPGAQLLVTSRRPVHLVEERLYPVAPLALAVADPTDPDLAALSPAVTLFVSRARLVNPAFRLSPANAADVVELCRRLDGLPLAIELTAARSRLLSPMAMLSRLDGGATDPVPATDRAQRQRSLDATVRWSYELLDEGDRAVFQRLGAFAGRADLEAVQRVAGTADSDPLDAVTRLVDLSLIEVAEGPEGEPTVGMLETIRRFARHRLRESGDWDAVRLRHAQWCLEVATGACALLGGPNQTKALDRMSAVEQDVRAALDWCLVPPSETDERRRECGHALLVQMCAYWYRFGYVAEGRGWQQRALETLDDSSEELNESLADALHGMGVLMVTANDLKPGIEVLTRALEASRSLGDPGREARELNSLGVAVRESGDVPRARALLEQSISLARQEGLGRREATALSNMVLVLMDAADYPGAVEAGRRAVEADRALGDPWGLAISESNLVVPLLLAEGPDAAYAQLTRVVPGALAVEDAELAVALLESLATILAARGEVERTARALGAVERERLRIGIPRSAPDEALVHQFVGPVKATVPPEVWEANVSAGRSLSLQEALADGLPPSDPARGRVTASHQPH